MDGDGDGEKWCPCAPGELAAAAATAVLAQLAAAAVALFPSSRRERKAMGLVRKQEARAESEKGEAGLVAPGPPDLLEGYTSLRRHKGAISRATSAVLTVWRRVRRGLQRTRGSRWTSWSGWWGWGCWYWWATRPLLGWGE